MEVYKPDYYVRGGLECEQVIDAMTDGFDGTPLECFYYGCAIKYLFRWWTKGDPDKDLRKCICYIEKLRGCGCVDE